MPAEGGGDFSNLEEPAEASPAAQGPSKWERRLPWSGGSSRWLQGVVLGFVTLSVVLLLLCAMALELAAQLHGAGLREDELAREVAALQALAAAPAAPIVDDSRKRCSGRGSHEHESCRCDDCWGGITCSERLIDCMVNANSGTPYLFEDYWVAHPEASVTIKPAYHIGYGSAIGTQCASLNSAGCGESLLHEEIRKMHKAFGNLDTEGYHLVISPGSTQMNAAALWALSDVPESKIWSEVPYYSGYAGYTALFKDAVTFTDPPPKRGDTPPSAPEEGKRIIEFVTSPNNPDGEMRTARVQGPGARAIYDSAYLWPMYTPVSGPLNGALRDSDVAVFTLSKITGHASTRLGWAFTRNKDVAQRMDFYVGAQGVLARENQLRALKVLEHARGSGYEVVEWARGRMQERWKALRALFSGSVCYSLPPPKPPARDMWSGLTFEPAPAYAYVKCVRGGDCYEELKGAGVLGRPGRAFGDGDEYVRLELLMNDGTFDLLVERLTLIMRGCTA